MMLRLALLFALLATPAFAGLTKAQLKSVGVHAPENAQLPTALSFRDIGGKTLTLKQAIGGTPAIVLFADYTCKTLCGPILEITSAALAKSGLRPAKDFHLVVIGMDPRDSADQARSFTTPQIDKKIAQSVHVLTGNGKAVVAVSKALGYHYVYDKANDQFAHPTAAFVVSGSGKLSTVLSAVGLTAQDVRLALVSAGHGAVGSLGDQLRLLCYCFDPRTGIYSADIGHLIDGAAAITVLLLGGLMIVLLRHERKRRA